MKLIVDRITEQVAICENEEGNMISLALSLFPERIAEGDIISYENDTILILAEETKEKRRELKERMNRLFKK